MYTPNQSAFLFATLILMWLIALPAVAEDYIEQADPHAGHQKTQVMQESNSLAPSMQMDHSQHNQHEGHGNHGDHKMTLDDAGMVMNWNENELPKDCNEISRDYEMTVRAGTKYAYQYSGNIYGMDSHEWKVEPCSRLSVTFINDDEVRHQWMVHGLPRYLYPLGMFHLEAAGGAQKTGTFIVPSDDRTFLVHCDLAQHMEMGMKAQLVVGRGGQDFPSVPGVTAHYRPDGYDGLNNPLRGALALFSLVLVLVLGYKWSS